MNAAAEYPEKSDDDSRDERVAGRPQESAERGDETDEQRAQREAAQKQAEQERDVNGDDE